MFMLNLTYFLLNTFLKKKSILSYKPVFTQIQFSRVILTIYSGSPEIWGCAHCDVLALSLVLYILSARFNPPKLILIEILKDRDQNLADMSS